MQSIQVRQQEEKDTAHLGLLGGYTCTCDDSDWDSPVDGKVWSQFKALLKPILARISNDDLVDLVQLVLDEAVANRDEVNRDDSSTLGTISLRIAKSLSDQAKLCYPASKRAETTGDSRTMNTKGLFARSRSVINTAHTQMIDAASVLVSAIEEAPAIPPFKDWYEQTQCQVCGLFKQKTAM